jgi:uncharacterized membrane protein YjgN (DUF898 family)
MDEIRDATGGAALRSLAPMPLTFTGSGPEYFRIWIVNLMLTIATLGIYSAWAKVRRLKYFYQNTRLAGASFNYHGNPKAILKGRGIALVLLLAWKYAPINELWGAAIWIAFAAVWPWVLVRSLKFKRRNSSYRNVRFRFDGAAREVYLPFTMLLGILFIVAFALQSGAAMHSGPHMLLGLSAGVILVALVPHFHFVLQQFAATRTLFGQTRARYKARVWDFYKVYLLPVVAVIAGIFLFVALIAAAAFAGKPRTGIAVGIGIATVVLVYGFILFVGPYFTARLQNLTWSNMRLGPHRFESRARVWPLFRITLVNLLLIVLTLGFYRPFAVVRLMRYRIESVSMLPGGDLESFVSGSGAEVAAFGEEALDMFDFDIAL